MASASASSVGLGIGLVFLGYYGFCLAQNIQRAKSTQLPYTILPFHMLSIPWALTRRLLLPLLDCLPDQWTAGWVPFVRPCYVY